MILKTNCETKEYFRGATDSVKEKGNTMVRYILIRLLDLAELLILIRVIISWLPIGHNRFAEILYMMTEPVLAPIRRLLDGAMGSRRIMFDFSPIIAFLLIGLIKNLIASSVYI